MRAKRAHGIGALLLVLFGCALTARATDADYRELALHAGIIFRGSVEAVVRVPAAAPGEVPILRITFRVHDAICGARAGGVLTIHQWDGPSGESYRVGEALVLFLYRPSGGLGLTSAVGGHRIPAEDAEVAWAAAREAQSPAEPEPDIPPPGKHRPIRHRSDRAEVE